jgi:hypothetical protein
MLGHPRLVLSKIARAPLRQEPSSASATCPLQQARELLTQSRVSLPSDSMMRDLKDTKALREEFGRRKGGW